MQFGFDAFCFTRMDRDTAGQERFRSMTSAFYNRAQGVVICFDVSQHDSFISVPAWIRDVKAVSMR
jgi:GTPase SAR1 family protein